MGALQPKKTDSLWSVEIGTPLVQHVNCEKRSICKFSLHFFRWQIIKINTYIFGSFLSILKKFVLCCEILTNHLIFFVEIFVQICKRMKSNKYESKRKKNVIPKKMKLFQSAEKMMSKLDSKQLKSVFYFLILMFFSCMTSNRQLSFHEKKNLKKK